MQSKFFKYRMLLIVFIIILLDGVFLFFHQSSKLQKSLDLQTIGIRKTITQDFNTRIFQTQHEYTIKINHLLEHENIRQLFAEQEREKLYEALLEQYKMLQQLDPFLEIMTFRLPDGSAFLRMHKPDMFGDALNEQREIIKDVNKHKSQMFGFEIGKLKMSYRVVTPIFLDGIYLGLVEIGISTEKFTHHIESLFHTQQALIVKHQDTKISMEQKEYLSFDGYTLISKKALLKNIFLNSLHKHKGEDSFIHEENKKYYAVENQLNLFDQRNQIVAKILLINDISKFYEEYDIFIKETTLSIVIVSIVILLLLNFSFNFFIEKLEKSKNDLRTRVLQEIELSSQLQRSMEQFGENVISIHFDKEGIITYASAALLQESGLSQDEVVGQHFLNLLHPDVNKKIFEDMHNVLEYAERWDAELRLIKKLGDPLWLECSVLHNYDSNNELIGYNLIAHDITAQKAKDQFMSNMSHELRTPLNAIIGFSTLLLKKLTDNEHIKITKHIRQSSLNLLSLINDILDLAKIKHSNFSISPYEFDAYESMVGFSQQFEGLAHEKTLHFQTIISENLKGIFYGDLTRINQISLNLISNAIKFTPKDGEITFKIDYEDENLILTISDNGIGMSKTVQNKIFKPFEQADGSTTRKYGGTGLGLSITQTLVEAMQGKIELKSAENVGTTFTVTLPLQRSQKTIQTTHAPLSENLQKEGKLEGHILIAEDNKTNQILVKMMIEEYELTCDIANDGVEAVAMYNPKKHALILMDENMPNMNGIVAMEQIRSRFKDECTPIIALTANAMEGDKARFLEAGMDDYIAKPINEQELYTVLQKYLLKAQS